jgi:hypothetical protein
VINRNPRTTVFLSESDRQPEAVLPALAPSREQIFVDVIRDTSRAVAVHQFNSPPTWDALRLTVMSQQYKREFLENLSVGALTRRQGIHALQVNVSILLRHHGAF